MNTIALDFSTILWIVGGLIVLGLCHKLVWFLATLSDGFIGFITHIGLKSVAKALLTILVNYDQRTYRRSRFMLQNQVPFRFALLWAFFLITLLILCVLKMGRTIHSVRLPILLITVGYVTYRSFMHWVAPHKSTQDSVDFTRPEVKEQYQRSYSLIRRWDYLDELFAQAS